MTPWAGREPRRWQAEALPLVLQALRQRRRGIVSATMGSGKSVLIARVCASGRGRVLVTVPTIRLVKQISATIEEECPGDVGRYFTDAKESGKRITVACLPSVPALVEDPGWPGPPALWIADEAHKTEAPQLLAAYKAMGPERAIGFTATPFRASEREDLSLWDEEIYAYGMTAALRDGVIVPFRVIQWTGADDTQLDDACLAMIRRHGVPAGPGLVNSISIQDAEEFAARLTAAGIPAGVVHCRLSDGDVTATMARLEAGDLAAVVHVNMLSEGVDYPWLRWLCLRRKVGSRVRFCQEVGRVLRAHPGKREALLLDPLDLMGALALSYEAVLSGMAAEPTDSEPFATELHEAERAVPDNGEGKGQDLSAKTLAAWHRYLRSIYLSAIGRGLIECRVKSTRWRTYPATIKQLPMVERLAGGLSRDTSIPLPHRRMLGKLCEHRQELTRGDVSDLISLGLLFRSARSARSTNADVWAQLAAPDGE
jgi:hypothetical protein